MEQIICWIFKGLNGFLHIKLTDGDVQHIIISAEEVPQCSPPPLGAVSSEIVVINCTHMFSFA